MPALTQVVGSTLFICNRDAAATKYRCSVAVAGAVDTEKQYLFYDTDIEGNATERVALGMTLGPADKVRVYATLATLSFNLFGVEVTA